MVINGPFEHPGANAVEDETGRLVNLSHMSLQAIFSSSDSSAKPCSEACGLSSALQSLFLHLHIA